MTPDDRDTTPAPPLLGSLSESTTSPVIPAGGAQRAVVDALETLLRAVLGVEAAAMAVARQLDATAPPGVHE